MTSPLAYIYDRGGGTNGILAASAAAEKQQTYTEPRIVAASANNIAASVEQLNLALQTHIKALENIDQRLRAIVAQTNEQQRQQQKQWEKIETLDMSQKALQQESLSRETKVVEQPTATPANNAAQAPKSATKDYTWQLVAIILGSFLLILIIYWMAKSSRESTVQKTSRAVEKNLRGSIDRMVNDAISKSLRGQNISAANSALGKGVINSRPVLSYGGSFQ